MIKCQSFILFQKGNKTGNGQLPLADWRLNLPYMDSPFPETWYRARVIKVVDGDTVDVVIDTGFRTARTERVRVIGIDTAELSSKDAQVREKAVAAKEFVAKWLDQHGSTDQWPLLIKTYKTDSFGRYLGDIKKGGTSLKDDLLKTGLAVEYKKG